MLKDYYNWIDLEKGDQEDIDLLTCCTKECPYKKKNIVVNDRIMHIIQLRDGRLAVSAGSALYIYIKNTFNLQLIIDKHKGEINSFTELKNGLIITCSDDKTMNVIKLSEDNNYDVIQVLKEHKDYVYKIIEIKENEYISISKDTKYAIWKINTSNKFYYIQSIIYNDRRDSSNIIKINDNEFAISILNEDFIQFWNANTYTIITRVKLRANWPRKNMCLITQKILGVCGLNDLSFINVYTHKIIFQIEGLSFTSIIKCNNGHFLCAIDDNGENSLAEFDLKLNKISEKTDAHSSKILCVEELKNGTIVSGGEDEEIKFWSD